MAATVVAPSLAFATAEGRSLAESFGRPSAVAINSSSESSSPTFATPPITPIVAGTAPSARTVLFSFAGNVQVLGAGQSVGDQGRLERHDGRPFSQGLPNFGPDLEAQAAGSMQRSSLLRGLLT